ALGSLPRTSTSPERAAQQSRRGHKSCAAPDLPQRGRNRPAQGNALGSLPRTSTSPESAAHWARLQNTTNKKLGNLLNGRAMRAMPSVPKIHTGRRIAGPVLADLLLVSLLTCRNVLLRKEGLIPRASTRSIPAFLPKCRVVHRSQEGVKP